MLYPQPNLFSQKAWSRALANPAQEFPPTFLPVLQGRVPEGLRGSLYYNGPARFERGGHRVGHLFDGDGAILSVHFTNEGVIGVYRYVKTAGYLEEEKANQFLYSNYGNLEPKNLLIKNSANISVLALPNKLLALWEAGSPHALNLKTLETLGLDNLGELEDGLPYSAHPKVDPQTGEILNFGISFEAPSNATLNLYKSDATGRIIKKNKFPLNGIPLVHDFALAGSYLVFFIPPVLVNYFLFKSGLSSYSDSIQWQFHLGTQILIFERETLNLVARNQTAPWFQWHFGNGYVDNDGTVVVDLVRYSDFYQTNQNLKEVATGKTETPAKGTLWQVRLNPRNGEIISNEEILERYCDFPTISHHQVGRAWRYTYLVLHREGVDIAQERYGAIARFDRQTKTYTEADFGENRYPAAPIVAQDLLNSEKNWVLTTVYDGNFDTSKVFIFDSERLSASPVCILGLPSVIPLNFHGTWKL